MVLTKRVIENTSLEEIVSLSNLAKAEDSYLLDSFVSKVGVMERVLRQLNLFETNQETIDMVENGKEFYIKKYENTCRSLVVTLTQINRYVKEKTNNSKLVLNGFIDLKNLKDVEALAVKLLQINLV